MKVSLNKQENLFWFFSWLVYFIFTLIDAHWLVCLQLCIDALFMEHLDDNHCQIFAFILPSFNTGLVTTFCDSKNDCSKGFSSVDGQNNISTSRACVYIHKHTYTQQSNRGGIEHGQKCKRESIFWVSLQKIPYIWVYSRNMSYLGCYEVQLLLLKESRAE